MVYLLNMASNAAPGLLPGVLQAARAQRAWRRHGDGHLFSAGQLLKLIWYMMMIYNIYIYVHILINVLFIVDV